MEAAGVSRLAPARELSGDRAARIVEAMRASVAERGFSGSTFEHVARQAGVSRGLLHYHFGTKERLLVEAVRRECEVRHELLDKAVADASSPDELLAGLVHTLEDMLQGDGPSSVFMYFEMVTLAQRNAEIAAELSELGRKAREHIAAVLAAKADAGVLALRADPNPAAELVLALADGVLVRRLTEPDFDVSSLLAQSIEVVRGLFG